jgi:hypothetical protein|tara:strand:- start:1129 stop:1449 length:321 start_codon:yes stop_codon:yes gene_type:complete
MEKAHLQSKLKSTGKAYVYFCFFGAHYLYLRKTGIQLFFWITLGGFGIWALFDLFALSSKVHTYNDRVFRKIEELKQQGRFMQEPRNVEILKRLNSDKKNLRDCDH